MPGLSCAELQRLYGDELQRPPLSEVGSAYFLMKALAARVPPVLVSFQACRTWWSYHRLPAGAVRVGSVAELEGRYGDVVRGLVVQSHTSYLLTRALLVLSPPLYASDAVVRQWLRLHGGGDALTQVFSAGPLVSLESVCFSSVCFCLRCFL